MEQIDTTLLKEIETFCETHNLSLSRFGRVVLNDPALVLKMRRGRKLRKATRRRLRRFMGSRGE